VDRQFRDFIGGLREYPWRVPDVEHERHQAPGIIDFILIRSQYFNYGFEPGFPRLFAVEILKPGPIVCTPPLSFPHGLNFSFSCKLQLLYYGYGARV